MKAEFGTLADGKKVSLYTLRRGKLTAKITDFGATLVSLAVPDREGNLADVVLGYDDVQGYLTQDGYLGATVGRNANRVKNAAFVLGGTTWTMPANENTNNLHSGPDGYSHRLWTVENHTESSVTLSLSSPHGDQGFPGNARILVTYSLEHPAALKIAYRAVSDRDTVFNLTNHAYFNLAGHDQTDRAMDQILSMPARFYNPADGQSIPTGELAKVAGTPMDFRKPKALGQDIGEDFSALNLQGGYDHNFEVFCNPCATLHDPYSRRTMTVSTDCPGIQVYSGNYMDMSGKGGVHYPKRSAVCLETQFYPDSVNHPEWPQPITKAGEVYQSETVYAFV